jgi:hypothetical protein
MHGTVHLFIEKVNRLCTELQSYPLKVLHTLFTNDITAIVYFFHPRLLGFWPSLFGSFNTYVRSYRLRLSSLLLVRTGEASLYAASVEGQLRPPVEVYLKYTYLCRSRKVE